MENSPKRRKYKDNSYELNIIDSKYIVKLKDKKKNISDNDILQEAILKIYRKNRKQTKYDLFLNYISNTSNENKYKNKYKVEQSIKKINDEMEEAVSEFSKLFNEKTI